MNRKSTTLALVLVIQGLVGGLEARELWSSQLELARMALDRGDTRSARSLLDQAVRLAGKPQVDHLPIHEELNVLGAMLAQSGEIEEGVRVVNRAHSLAEKAVGKGSPQLEPFLSMLGTLRLQQGKSREAADLLRKAYLILEPRVEMNHPAFQEVIRNYAEAARKAGRTREVLRLHSLYGYVVDLGPIDEPASAPEPEVAATPTEPVVEVAEEYQPPQLSRGEKLRRLNRLAMYFQHLGPGMQKLKQAKRWLSKKKRRYEGFRRFKLHVIRDVHRDAMGLGRMLAQLAMISSRIRHFEKQNKQIEEISHIMKHKNEQLVRYEKLVGVVADDLKLLLERLGKQVKAS